MFAGQRPTFKEVDEVTFMRPVDVGDLLKFRSCIIHTAASASCPNKVPRHTHISEAHANMSDSTLACTGSIFCSYSPSYTCIHTYTHTDSM